MKIKNCALISLILLTGCNLNVSVSNNKTSQGITSSGAEKSSSQKPFDSTPFIYEPGTITLPEDRKVDGRDKIGRAYDATEIKTLYIHSDYVLYSRDIFNSEWKYYDVLEKDGAPTYIREDHKPSLEFDSVLVSDIDQLPNSYTLKNTNIDISLGCYKNYLNKRTKMKDSDARSTLVYHARANAIYYTESFPAFESFKDECISHVNSLFINKAKETCEANTKEKYADFFHQNGTHVIWSAAFGMGTEMLYEAYSNDYDLNELATKEVKDLFDKAALAGVNSKTVGEYEQNKSFKVKDYLNVEGGKYVFESGINGSLIGGPADFPPMTLSGLADKINASMTSKTENVKQSSFLTPKVSYPIWEFLPETMSEEKVLLENAYKDYLKDKTEYYLSLANE